MMLHLVKTERAYSPETVAAMTAAFEKVCQSFSAPINGNETVRETLALIILRHVDQGERDPTQLAELALHELTGHARSELASRSATG